MVGDLRGKRLPFSRAGRPLAPRPANGCPVVAADRNAGVSTSGDTNLASAPQASDSSRVTKTIPWLVGAWCRAVCRLRKAFSNPDNGPIWPSLSFAAFHSNLPLLRTMPYEVARMEVLLYLWLEEGRRTFLDRPDLCIGTDFKLLSGGGTKEP